VSDNTDFFVSYTSVDAAWAEWIAWTLEKDGSYKVCIQAWDFVPGTNFVLEMHQAAARSRHIIAVLSPAYLRADFTGAEWAAAFTRDPLGSRRRLIPVMVETCQPEGLLTAIVHISVIGLDEASARDALLSGVSGQQGGRPPRAPAFPGARPLEHPAAPPSFPGPGGVVSHNAVRAPVTNARPRPEHPASEPVPSDLSASEPLPWVPLATSPAVRWEADLSRAADAPLTSRLELHLIPLSSGASVAKPDLGVLRNALVTVGRTNGIFPPTATISVQTAADYVDAVLTAPASAAEAGLRVHKDGERSGWLCLPPAETADIMLSVTAGLSRLLAALINLPRALPERVTFAAAVSGQAKLPPQDWLPSRDLTLHAQQVVAHLGRQLIAATSVREPTQALGKLRRRGRVTSARQGAVDAIPRARMAPRAPSRTPGCEGTPSPRRSSPRSPDASSGR
jgi:hypothetical protein